jgi:hypothetical protein
MVWPIYQGDPNWVPPLKVDRLKVLDPIKNPYWKTASQQLFLAERDGELVGRIAAIYDPRYEESYGEKMGCFGFFEAIDDQKVADSLFDSSHRWLGERGCTSVIGPLNPSINDEAGLLVEGFDDPPQVLTTYNPEYYIDLIESYGFTKEVDLWGWRLTREFLTPKLKRVRDLVASNTDLKLRNFQFSPKSAFLEDIGLIQRIYNSAWEANWGSIRMTDEEILALGNDLKLVAEKDMVIIAESGGEPVGFVLALPDINQVLIRNRRGGLSGLLPILFGSRSITRGRIVALGLIPGFRNRGIDAALYYEIGTRMTGPHGYIESEASWVLEENHPMNHALEMMKGERYKTWRLYKNSIKMN